MGSSSNGTPRKPSLAIRKVLTGQVALVTGGSSGIGAGIALALGKAGANVLVNYHSSPEGAKKVVAQLKELGVKAIAHRADVSSEDEVTRMFAHALDEFGRLDILVSNAGMQKDVPFESMTLDDWNQVLSVNLTGQFLCVREAVRIFREQELRQEISRAAGKIICMSSVHEFIPWAGRVNYAASKGGVMLLMKSVAQEVAPLRIRVNAIAPGAIRTPINEEAWSNEESYRDLMELVPVNRIGEVEDIGRAAVWLVSDDADYVHGHSLVVDGGMALYPSFAEGG